MDGARGPGRPADPHGRGAPQDRSAQGRLRALHRGCPDSARRHADVERQSDSRRRLRSHWRRPMRAAPRVPCVAVAAAAVMMVLAPSARRASAQTTPRSDLATTTPSEQSQGPLVVTPISRRVVFTPDVKVTTVNGRTSTFVGGSAGIEIDDRFFIGGAAYGMVAPLDTATMFYGGLLTGYRLVGDDNVAITVRGL